MSFKWLSITPLLLLLLVIATACSSPADVASKNTSLDADYFRVMRRIVFVNGITDKYLFSIEGYCSLGNNDPATRLSVTCKVGPDTYKKHFLGLSDNMTYFVEQLEPVKGSEYHYKVVFRPETLIPDLSIQ